MMCAPQRGMGKVQPEAAREHEPGRVILWTSDVPRIAEARVAANRARLEKSRSHDSAPVSRRAAVVAGDHRLRSRHRAKPR